MKQSSPARIREFTDLIAWRESHALVVAVYRETRKFPHDEQFGLVSQMRRAAVSVTSNIAEGFGRYGYKEKIQLYRIAHASLVELKNQLFVARDVGYLQGEEYLALETQLITAHRLLQGLITKSRSLLNHVS
jgi:four helix bundle protein